MCETYPQRRPELDLYEADIGSIYEEIFYQYHCQFTKKAAAYLEKGINKDLFQLVVGGVRTKLCEHCFQSDHQSPFCPTQYNVQGPINNGRRQNDTVRRKHPDNKLDRKGQTRLEYQGKEICNNFNSNASCSHVSCLFAHVCKKMQIRHPW